ncbi:TPA: low affinity iron permease family protein [Legionella feeleii]|uniref:Low affinity iron permease n=1 Tax=Legionella feeleii TaxID=453 RepID=A0A0W0U0C1_9GAMM|nr:low affinity iron permease family protein [Legionella feeleii]KTD01199.1 Low affinity iron permease [Legionella feeleii]SPX62305.1 Predicted small integral membrane protein [Legionella feeleii]STX37934.1 Predicted small integral membrane protein [Legionella feeleii]
MKAKNDSNHFNNFAKRVSLAVGHSGCFIIALSLVFIWLITGPLFHFSDTWQLIINTGTTIITFLMVFLIQNTQNRDTKILNLKIDELIKTKKNARNSILDLDKLSDEDLRKLEEEYKKLCKNK